MSLSRCIFLVALAATVGCDVVVEGDVSLEVEAGDGSVDAGALDAGDTSAGDAGELDAGAPDAGTPDAGTLDAGTIDAGADGGVDAGSGGGGLYACTEIHGAPQSTDTVTRKPAWFAGGAFEQVVGQGTWQLLDGAGANHWRYANDAVWTRAMENPCAPPAVVDRVVQVLWSDHVGDTLSGWLSKIDEIVRMARVKSPTVRTIVLQPTAGLAGCPDMSSVNQPLVVQAINTYVATADAGDVRAGPVISVSACSDVVPPFDRLTDAAAPIVARAYGTWYAP